MASLAPLVATPSRGKRLLGRMRSRSSGWADHDRARSLRGQTGEGVRLRIPLRSYARSPRVCRLRTESSGEASGAIAQTCRYRSTSGKKPPTVGAKHIRGYRPGERAGADPLTAAPATGQGRRPLAAMDAQFCGRTIVSYRADNSQGIRLARRYVRRHGCVLCAKRALKERTTHTPQYPG